MEEIVTVAGIAAGGVYVAQKVFGPSLDTIGAQLADLVDFRKRNAVKIAEYADRFGGSESEYVHPRVAQRFVEDLSWLDDDLMQRYAGGLLAASRSEGGEDDRSIRYLNTVSDMTKAEIRLHFLIFRGYYEAFKAQGGLNDQPAFWNFKLRAPFVETCELMFPGRRDWNEMYAELTETLAGLAQLGLVLELTTAVQAPRLPGDTRSSHPVAEIRMTAGGTQLGALLFLQARGAHTSNPHSIASIELPAFDPTEPRLTSAELVR